MKKLVKHVTSVLIALMCITTLFPATALAADTYYTIDYKIDPSNVLTAATYLNPVQENCVDSRNTDDLQDPKGCTAAKDAGDYEFDKWVVEINGVQQDELPANWSTTNEGRTLVFTSPEISVVRDSATFVAKYKAKVVEEVVGTEKVNDTEEEAEESTNPKTSDFDKMLICIIIATLSLITITSLIISANKKRN